MSKGEQNSDDNNKLRLRVFLNRNLSLNFITKNKNLMALISFKFSILLILIPKNLFTNSLQYFSLRQVKVFNKCFDVLHQNLFFGAITLSLQEKKLVHSGTKFVPP